MSVSQGLFTICIAGRWQKHITDSDRKMPKEFIIIRY